MSEHETAPEVFVSYSHSNRRRVSKLVEALKRFGVSVWFDESEIYGGDDFNERIAHAIVGCKVLVLMASKPAFKSRHVIWEVNRAARENKTIIPLFLESGIAAPPKLGPALEEVHVLRLRSGNPGATLKALINSLRNCEVRVEEEEQPGEGVSGHSVDANPPDNAGSSNKDFIALTEKASDLAAGLLATSAEPSDAEIQAVCSGDAHLAELVCRYIDDYLDIQSLGDGLLGRPRKASYRS